MSGADAAYALTVDVRAAAGRSGLIAHSADRRHEDGDRDLCSWRCGTCRHPEQGCRCGGEQATDGQGVTFGYLMRI
ncbi:hypothetical protein GCM10022206_82140 [Streptomyces chiangmaiensis]